MPDLPYRQAPGIHFSPLRGFKSQWVIIKCYFFVWLLHQKGSSVALGSVHTQILKNSFSHKKQTALSRQRCPRCCSSAPYSSLPRWETKQGKGVVYILPCTKEVVNPGNSCACVKSSTQNFNYYTLHQLISSQCFDWNKQQTLPRSFSLSLPFCQPVCIT